MATLELAFRETTDYVARLPLSEVAEALDIDTDGMDEAAATAAVFAALADGADDFRLRERVRESGRGYADDSAIECEVVPVNSAHS